MNEIAKDYLEVSQEARNRMVMLRPEYTYLIQMHEVQSANFDRIKHTLSQREQDQIETLLLRGELLLLKAKHLSLKLDNL